jgi:hypothetical protein
MTACHGIRIAFLLLYCRTNRLTVDILLWRLFYGSLIKFLAHLYCWLNVQRSLANQLESTIKRSVMLLFLDEKSIYILHDRVVPTYECQK